MRSAIVIFIVFLLIGVGGGYLYFQNKGQDLADAPQEIDEEQVSEGEPDTVTIDSEASIFSEKGCLTCHAVSSLGLEGGATGPDLSTAYGSIEGKHGKPLEEYLKEPTSAVMSSVISENPLTDEEIDKIAQLLKEASEK